MERHIPSFTPRPARIRTILLGVIAGLVTLSLLGEYGPYLLGHETSWGFVEEVALDKENNIPTYVSSLLLLVISVCAWVIARWARQQRHPFQRHWLGLALVALFGVAYARFFWHLPRR